LSDTNLTYFTKTGLPGGDGEDAEYAVPAAALQGRGPENPHPLPAGERQVGSLRCVLHLFTV